MFDYTLYKGVCIVYIDQIFMIEHLTSFWVVHLILKQVNKRAGQSHYTNYISKVLRKICAGSRKIFMAYYGKNNIKSLKDTGQQEIDFNWLSYHAMDHLCAPRFILPKNKIHKVIYELYSYNTSTFFICSLKQIY